MLESGDNDLIRNAESFDQLLTFKQFVDFSRKRNLYAFEGENFYLGENGDIVMVGGAYCGIECTPKKEVVRLSYTNGKLNITKK